MENKMEILDLLLPLLQATRRFYDLQDLIYAKQDDDYTELVTAVFPGGKVVCNVTADSGIAMIRDIIRQLEYNA